MEKTFKRGEIHYADLPKGEGSEQGGLRPVLIVQNDIGNKYSPTTLIAPLTSKLKKKCLPTHVLLKAENIKLKQDSLVLLEQIRVIDKNRLIDYIAYLDENNMTRVEIAIMLSFGITMNLTCN